jgi:hypothetical protein
MKIFFQGRKDMIKNKVSEVFLMQQERDIRVRA